MSSACSTEKWTTLQCPLSEQDNDRKIDCQEAKLRDLFKQYLQHQQHQQGYRKNKGPYLNTSSSVLGIIISSFIETETSLHKTFLVSRL